jgi:hypothetical protein
MKDDWDDIPAQSHGVDLETEVARLANLAPQEYETARTGAVRSLGVRVGFLDAEVQKQRLAAPAAPGEAADGTIIETLEPWPQPVDGASLAEEVRDTLQSYVIFGAEGDADVATLWSFGSYLMDTWRLWPRLMITSPTKQCGKSTLLEVIDAVAHRGLIISNIKSAGVFRAIEAWRPTLLMDEADTWMKADDEMAGILNSGHTRRMANVVRVQEKNGELTPVQFSTWCPMVIAGIGTQRDTLMSRSVLIGLRRKLPHERVARLPFDLHERSVRLRRQAARWAADNAITLAAMTLEPPECGNDRRRDNFTPLWRIAQLLGGVWPGRIDAAYQASSQAEDDDEPAGVLMLRDLMETFGTHRDATALPSSDLVIALTEMEERPWSEWRHGRPITAQTIARLMRPFGVRPGNSRVRGQVMKAYQRVDIHAAFVRYVPQPGSEPLRRYNDEIYGKISNRPATSGAFVAGRRAQ